MYELELTKIIENINEKGHKRIMLQLPDGLKPQAKDIVDEIENNTKANCFIWFSSCYGACDLPQGMDMLKIDLFVQFGHNRFIKTEW